VAKLSIAKSLQQNFDGMQVLGEQGFISLF